MKLARAPQRELGWWRNQFKESGTQGVVIPAGGTHAYYSSAIPGHTPAPKLSNPNLYREMRALAAEMGLIVLAGIDCGFLGRQLAESHPDWEARDAFGRPILVEGRIAACINGGYFTEFIPYIIREIVDRSAPAGILSTGWSGLNRSYVCHCTNCERQFHQATQRSLPASADWNDPVYLQWIRWSYDLRVKRWVENVDAAQSAGGHACQWVGRLSATRLERAHNLQDLRALSGKAPIVFVGTELPLRSGRFRDLIAEGDYLRQVMRAKPVVFSQSLDYLGQKRFPLTAAPAAETRLSALAAVTGGMQLGIDGVTDPSADRRGAGAAAELFKWLEQRESYLRDLSPVALVGLVWSQQNADLYGRSQDELLSYAPYAGMVHALSRSNVGFRSIDIDDLDRELGHLSVVILPNIAAMSEQSVASIRRFVSKGGTLIASGETSLYDQWGEPRADFGLADVFGAHLTAAAADRLVPITRITPSSAFEQSANPVGRLKGPATDHSYLRLHPEFAGRTAGPHRSGELNESASRHAILNSFDETDLLAFGGLLFPLRVEPDRTVLLTYVPPFPSSPIDKVYMTVERTQVPGLVVGRFGKGRVAFMPADIDRRYGIDPIPDHAAILMNLLQWALDDLSQVSLRGAGVVCARLYRQQDSRLILQLINLTGADNDARTVARFLPVGPLKVRVRSPGPRVRSVRIVGAEGNASVVPIVHSSTDAIEFDVHGLIDHMLYVLE